MMKAEQTRKIMEDVMNEKIEKNRNRSKAYARRVTETKFVRRARKGYNNCTFKVSRWYSPSIVIEALEKMGYEVVKRSSKNGRAVLVVKW
jgi:hypothetical protein